MLRWVGIGELIRDESEGAVEVPCFGNELY